jgi:peptide-methionine (R)-S-oxide reductase
MSTSSSRPKQLSDAEYKQKLTPQQYDVTRRGGTERAFSGKFYTNKRDGTYLCVCCATPLFRYLNAAASMAFLLRSSAFQLIGEV